MLVSTNNCRDIRRVPKSVKTTPMHYRQNGYTGYSLDSDVKLRYVVVVWSPTALVLAKARRLIVNNHIQKWMDG